MEIFLQHCQHLLSSEGTLFGTFLLGGIMGGFTHCLTMCGPVVACQRVCASGGCGAMASGFRWDYQAGRIASYATLGAVAAAVSAQLAALPFWPYLAAVLLVVAGSLFLMSALPHCKHPPFPLPKSHSLLHGALMGFMPCGLLYAALMMAAASAQPARAALAMALFAVGTLPALWLAHVGAGLLAKRFALYVHPVARLGMALNGVVLFAYAGNLVR